MPAGIDFDLITGILSFLFTLMVFSYLWGDNPLFRVAVYAFVGISAGYAAAVAWWQVIMPRLLSPAVGGGPEQLLLLALPLGLSILLLLKAIPGTARLSNVPTAFLVGVGAAVAIAGALLGTIFPQVLATVDQYDLVAATARGANSFGQLAGGSVFILGTLTTLAYFQFGVSARTGKRNALVEVLAMVGRFFIGVTLGALFAGAYAAAVTALIERLHALITFILSFL